METIEERIMRLEQENHELAKRIKRPCVNAEKAQEALGRAQNCRSLGNMATVIHEFVSRGIPASDIAPGDNVLTFAAWIALGRVVKRGEHGVKVATIIDGSKEDQETGERKTIKMMRSAAVFHISQTEPLNS